MKWGETSRVLAGAALAATVCVTGLAAQAKNGSPRKELPPNLTQPTGLGERASPIQQGVPSLPVQRCNTDADCPGCTRCRGGGCEWGELVGTKCMCDEECVQVGEKSCDRSRQKPLCGGVCTDAAPKRPLVCGRGDDTERVERFPGSMRVAPGAAVPSAETIVIESAVVSSDSGPPTPPPGQPTPFFEKCSVLCARLEVLGPVVELQPPLDDSAGQTAVTFAFGHWYVAWGGRPANATQIQRLTADGRIDGSGVRIEGTTPRVLMWSTHRGGELTLFGWVPPVSSGAGFMSSVHRFSPKLESAGAPLLLRGPRAPHRDMDVETRNTGELVRTTVLDRPGGLVREVRVPAGTSPRQTLAMKDWRLGTDVAGAFERIGDERFFVDVGEGALRVSALLDDGTRGPPQRIFDIPQEKGWQNVHSERVGGRWYVRADSPLLHTVRLRALDPGSRAPMGEVIVLSWPTGHPGSLVDANGTPMLLGNLQPFAARSRASFVPIDVSARAACAASTVVVPSLRDLYQTVRAVRFEGDVAGVTVDAWDGTGARRLFFTRLRCAR